MLARLDTLLANRPIDVLMVSVDQGLSPAQIRAVAKRVGVPPDMIAIDRYQVLKRTVNTTQLPLTLVINPHGQALWALYGQGPWDQDGALDWLNHLDD